MDRQNPLDVCPTLKTISLLFSMQEVMRIIYRRFDVVDKKFDLTTREALVLIGAYDNPQIQGQLADILGINRNVMVGVIDELEQKGLLKREPSPEKRGPNLIVDTAKGKRIVQYFKEHRRELLAEVFHPAPPEETERVLKWALNIVNAEYEK